MGGSPPATYNSLDGAVVGGGLGVPPSGTPSPVGRHAGDERGHPAGHVWVNTPHVGSRKDGGEWKMILAQVKIHPPTPPSSPHHGEEGWE